MIMEDMASDLAKRLKELKNKDSVESVWFTNGKLKYKLKDDPRVNELRSWIDLSNLKYDGKQMIFCFKIVIIQ